ncbi:MAG TPA: ankyrin repeat domain-containing protein [Acidimicrobiales bacterium]|nr:ankyrin repeat domain-containing protein [Acidimicrobiales bacterium]
MTPEEQALKTMAAIQNGDLDTLAALLEADPGLAASRLAGRGGGRTPLHVVADWPGYFPNGPRAASMLIDAGAVVDDRGASHPEGETPLHWTASNDDVDVAVVLIDAGADIEAPAGSIGTPLSNAVGYACWHVARLLVTRGARVDLPWHAAALGMLDRLEELLAAGPTEPATISQAFWHACSGGQRRAAQLLLDLGADLNWEPDYAPGTTPLDAARGRGTRRSNVIGWLEGLGARSQGSH